MNRIVIKSKNEEELRDKISKTLNLASDEDVIIKELKKPFKFLFISLDGEYEVQIVKKSEVKPEPKKVMKPEVKKVKENKVEKPVKVEKTEKKPEKKQEKKEQEKQEKQENKQSERLLDLLNITIKEFLATSNLDVIIKNISVNGNIYNVDIDGKDVKYIIGEKGIALASLEYLLMSIEDFRDVKIFIDSNNYKSKRESVLRELANRTAKSVLNSGKPIRLNPMPSRERKIIHEEIGKIQELETISKGSEPKRYLIIKLKNKK